MIQNPFVWLAILIFLVSLTRIYVRARRLARLDIDSMEIEYSPSEFEALPELDSATPSQGPPSPAERVHRWLERLHSQNLFNGVVAVSRDEELLMQATMGFANSECTVPITDRTSMRLASVSKQFTAAGILVLADDGQVSLDQDVSEILANFQYRDVTIRHLLNQTSGIPDSYMTLAKKHKKQLTGKHLTIAQAAELVATRGPKAKRGPLDQYAYSNTDYVLLAAVVETLTGQSFEAFMKAHLFDPLRLNQTRVWNLESDAKSFPGQADCLLRIPVIGPTKIEPNYLDGVAGDGAVFSSASDLVKWNSFWDGNELISNSLLNQAFIPPTLNDGSKSNYGFGWVITPEGAWHNGSWLGANTFVSRNHDSRLFVAVLDNCSNYYVDEIGGTIIKQFE